LLLSFEPHQEIPRGHQTPPNHNAMYAIDKDIFKVINNPTLEAAIRKGLVIIIGKQKNLWVKHLRPVNPMEELTPALLLQN
jgi:hypothetical protein